MVTVKISYLDSGFCLLEGNCLQRKLRGKKKKKNLLSAYLMFSFEFIKANSWADKKHTVKETQMFQFKGRSN